MTRRKSSIDQSVARCIAVTEAYRRHHGSTTQREEAAADLSLDDQTFREWLSEARKMGWLKPTE